MEEIFSKAAFLSIDYKTLLIFSGIYLVLFVSAEIAYHKFNVEVEYTRKYVHLFTGLIALFFPIYIHSPLDLLILCGSFAVLLILTLKFNQLKSVNAIDRKSRGSLMYPLIVVICFMFQFYRGTYMYFFIPILILAISDPLAALVGKKWPWGKFNFRGDTKTLAGSTAFFISALIISIIAFSLKETGELWYLLIISFVLSLSTALGEALSIKGYDNLIIPLCAVFVLLMFGI